MEASEDNTEYKLFVSFFLITEHLSISKHRLISVISKSCHLKPLLTRKQTHIHTFKILIRINPNRI